ncbi:hypothetical protein [Acinetobacter gandensis]|jgi:hypothetical protein|uniref:hypothetical protein n=1 Tax=Acinetobacter gandensis TaxID=1443941 RepID=UPI003F55AFB3
MFEFIGFVVVAYFAWKILRFFLFPGVYAERAERRYMENPTDANYKMMVAARMRADKQRNK